MGRIYTTVGTMTSTTQDDLFEIAAAADSIIRIHEIHVFQTLDLGDAEEETIQLQWVSGHATTGSGGTTDTPVPRMFADAASGAVVKFGNTTIASAGTPVVHYHWGWNLRIPFHVVFTPETRPVLSPSRRGVLRMEVAPTDSVTWGGTIIFEEIGG